MGEAESGQPRNLRLTGFPAVIYSSLLHRKNNGENAAKQAAKQPLEAILGGQTENTKTSSVGGQKSAHCHCSFTIESCIMLKPSDQQK